MDFTEFPKMARWSRNIIITEKIDGTNAQILIGENGEFLTGSRTRWVTPEDDNYGFSAWAHDNKEELLKLGPGRHFGEWWGQGIQRRYGLNEKRLSLFNVGRWREVALPSCVSLVPVLYEGPNDQDEIEDCLALLKEGGSVAAPGFMRPEGIIVFHTAGNVGFKKTLDKDEMPKSAYQQAA